MRSSGRTSSAARINAWLWTRGEPASVPVAPGVRLGSMPRGACASTTVIDLSAELCAPSSAADWRAFPMLDLIVPDPDALCTVAVEIERAVQEASRTGGEVTVCCALGRSRSAAAVAVWLVVFGGAADSAEAVAILRTRRPRIALDARDHCRHWRSVRPSACRIRFPTVRRRRTGLRKDRYGPIAKG